MNSFHPIWHGREFLRSSVVALAGLTVDIFLAWGLSVIFGVNLMLSAAAGFTAGAAFNYLLQEFWTFQRAERGRSLARILRYGTALGVTLATRLALVYTFSQILNSTHSELTILLLATILSFFVNYLASRHFVFKSSTQSKNSGKGNGR